MNEKQTAPVQEDEKIVLNDRCIDYVQQQFPTLSHEQVRQAIEEAGPVLKDIVEYAKRKYKLS